MSERLVRVGCEFDFVIDDMPDEAALHFCRVGYKAMEASMVYSVIPAPRLPET